MGGNREKKLDVEELENRVAPMGVVLVPADPDPNPVPNPAPDGGGANGDPQNLRVRKHQLGNSDAHRAKLFRKLNS